MTPDRRLSLGVMGHVDHGKTALVRALTGMETDRLPEEKRRGVSIVLGFAHGEFGGAEVDFIDMPGHERFVRTMIAGATGIGAVLLVVAANEGAKPQTVEHLEIAGLLGLERVLPVIAKADLVAPEQATACAQAVLARVAAAGFTREPPCIVSAATGAGLEALSHAIGRLADSTPPATDDGFPWLPIDRAFSIAGRGTVVTGTLRRGALSEADSLTLSPGGGEVRIRSLQVHGAPVARAAPGERVAVNLRGLEPSQAPRGAALSAPGVLAASTWFTLEVHALATAPPLKTGVRLAMLFGAAEVGVRLRLLDRDVMQPGDTALAQVETAEPVALPGRERVVLRVPSPAVTVAGGRVLDPVARRLRRSDAGTLKPLQALAAARPEEIVRLALAEAGPQGTPLMRLASLAGLSPGRTTVELKALGAWAPPGGLVVDPSAMVGLAHAVLSTVRAQAESQPNGVARRRLAALLPHASAGALEGAVSALTAAGRLRVEGGSVRLAPRRADETAQVQREAAVAEALAARLRDAGLAPPDLSELTATPAAKRALDRVLKDGLAVRTVDRVQKREVVFHQDAIEEARTRLAPRLAPPGVTVGEAGALLGMTRKYSVPLLEYLDTARFTRRIGDRRVLGPAGLGPESLGLVDRDC